MYVILYCLDSAFSLGIEKVSYKQKVLKCVFLVSASDCTDQRLYLKWYFWSVISNDLRWWTSKAVNQSIVISRQNLRIIRNGLRLNKNCIAFLRSQRQIRKLKKILKIHSVDNHVESLLVLISCFSFSHEILTLLLYMFA